MAALTKLIRLLLLFLLVECGLGLDFEGFFGGGPQGAGAAPGGGRGADREYYDLLGVDPGCTEADLKRAWRKLSLKNHPDRGGDAERFKQLNEAYQVLSDPQKRAAYDRFGKAAVDGSAPGPGPGGMDGGEGMSGGFPGGFAGFSGMGGFGGMGGMGGFGGMGGGVNLEELLNALNQGMRGQRTPQVLQVQVTLEELYTGAEKRLVLAYGGGQRREVTLSIVPGLPAGVVFRVEGGVHLRVKEKPHPTFERSGDHLHTRLSLSLYEALTGFRRQIKLLDGQAIWLGAEPNSAVTTPGMLRRLRGFGMPRFQAAGKGDLFVRFSVRFPEKPISGESAKLLKQVLRGSAGTASPSTREGERVFRLHVVEEQGASNNEREV